jgi:parvulin-like peptidyl-prolyl isomerase
MGRALRILILAAIAASTAACGGSSSSSNVASLQSGDVAVVGNVHITKQELDHQIKLEVRAMVIGSQSCTGGSQGQENCKNKSTKVPKVGTTQYTTTIVQPVVAYLVTQAQVQNIAKELHVTVTAKQLKTQVTQAIAQYYKGNQAKYEADLKKYDLTEADVEQQFKLTLLEQNIESKLKAQVKVTPKELRAYYNSHQSLYETTAATRTVDYVLVPSKSLAEKAHSELAAGKTFTDVAKGAIDDSSLHEPFVATEGQIDAAFQKPAFSLKTNELSGLVPVDKKYASTSLKGKCKPTCYFIIRPTAAVIKGGAKKSFASVEAQIQSTLLSSRQTAHLQSVVTKLENAQKKITRYAPGYKPPKTTTPSTGVPDTGESTVPAT